LINTSKYPKTFGSTKDQVAGILHSAICYGELLPGQELVQDTIAKELGVSRSPVREAFYELLSEGLIEYNLNRGFFVKQIDRNFWVDYFWIRVEFEIKSMTYICEATIDKHQFEDLQEREKLAYDQRNIPELSTINNLYLQMVCNLLNQLGHYRLSVYMSQLYRLAPRHFSEDSAELEEAVMITYSYHCRMYSAIINGDIVTVSELIKHHIEFLKHRYLTFRTTKGLDPKS